LNAFRFKGFDLAHENLADLYLKTAGFPTLFRESRWLWAPKQRMASVVISRSARYHNPDFPWKKVMDAFGQHAVFVGTPAEHAAFVQQFGSVNYAYTPDLLVAASIINAADLFIGNQSCPLAIAHGLGKRVLIEVCPYCPNCIFDRPDEYTKLEDVCLNGFREPSSIKVPCTAS
jgi:ADP-heptose:LPS heptosyltransferase